ncbi:MAG: hypothetical protein JJU02_07605 [Cryomorphaceae bacterium]|nr:hypothetical protein [Cryomorphaceae bacterium]
MTKNMAKIISPLKTRSVSAASGKKIKAILTGRYLHEITPIAAKTERGSVKWYIVRSTSIV